MTKNFPNTVLFFLLLFSGSVFAQSITTMNFLTYPSDPIAAGRGFTGTAADKNSFFLNPANLYSAQKYQGFIFERTYPNSWSDQNYFSFGAAYSRDNKNVFGITIRRLGWEGVPRTDADGNPLSEESVFEGDYGLRYAGKISDKMIYGFTFHFLQSHTHIDKKSWAVDVGFKWRQLLPFLTFTNKHLGYEFQQDFSYKKEKGINFGIALLNSGPHI